ncbi:sulfotransferase 1B1 [Procambarus clarkii]|uniref:sulfotransferase 1B1 n=1 Tax=Procambarus clarkii TaxID=6728 RepID=UPI0037436911
MSNSRRTPRRACLTPVQPLPQEVQEELKAKFQGLSSGLVKVGEAEHLLPPHCTSLLPKYHNFSFREDDVVVMTFPRSGTTWTQEIVWVMRNGLDFHTAKTVSLSMRSPFLEFDSLAPPGAPEVTSFLTRLGSRLPGRSLQEGTVFLQQAETASSPRTFKTHLPFSLLHPRLLNTCKVVYVARNPRDVCVSYYHQQRLVTLAGFLGDFAQYVDLWCRGLILQAPYWRHVEEGWTRRDHPNVLFLFYEDMKEDFLRELRRLDTFLGTSLTEEQLQEVAKFTALSGMKTRNTTNPMAQAVEDGAFREGAPDFVRKGTTGDWRNHFTPELEDKFEAWMSTGGKLAKDIPFRYQL